MQFTSTDAWILVSIHGAQGNAETASLANILAHADYANRAIPTFAEMESSTTRLRGAGLVGGDAQGLFVAAAFQDWWAQKFSAAKRLNVQKAIAQVEQYLNTEHRQASATEPAAPVFSHADYARACAAYLGPNG